MDLKAAYSQHTATQKSSMIRELVSQTKGIPGMISFAGGFPSPETFPKAEIGELFMEVVAKEGNDILQYGSSEGDPLLKKQIRLWENKEFLHDDDMLITVGSTNGIYLFTKTFINEGDVILSEAPSFLGSLIAFEALGAKIESVPLINDGLDIDYMESLLESYKNKNQNVKFLYTIPDFQNPTGITLSLEKRKRIVELAIKYQFMILEDNPYGELLYTGKPLPSIYDIARNDYQNDKIVTMIKSFSKILGPGLRLAYVIGHKDTITMMALWAQKVTVCPDCVSQRLVARFMEKGLMKPHIDFIRQFYKPFLEAMLNGLDTFMPKEITWTKPDGGIFLWVNCPYNMNCDLLFEKAIENKVTFIPGSKFYPSNQEKYNSLRLNFSYPTIEQIHIGIERLAQIMLKELKTTN